MNRISAEKRAAVIAALVEGNSIRATCRMTCVSKNTVTKLLVDMGTVCSVALDEMMRDLPCDRIEWDEIWSFCWMKARNIPAERRGERGIGDVWMWTAIDPVTKLVPSFLVGGRDMDDAQSFIKDLASRCAIASS